MTVSMPSKGQGAKPRRSLILVTTCSVILLITAAALVLGRSLRFGSGPVQISAECQATYAGLSRHAQLASKDVPAQTPPMGFSSYPHFGTQADEEQIRSIVDAIATDGLAQAGYRYVNVDDGWQGPRVNGQLTTNSRFPCGMKLLADYVHARGLKFGLYTTPASKSCGGWPGSYNHTVADVATFASWSVDAIKLDWCSADYSRARAITAEWHAAIEQSHRPMLLSINAGGNPVTGSWAKHLANTWRTSDDICPSWYNKARPHAPGATACYGEQYQSGVVDYLTTSDTEANAPNVGPGHWADPDSLEVGNIGINHDEARTQLSVWAMWSAPLIIGGDPRQMTASDLQLVLNPEFISVDQDPRGAMALKQPSVPDHQIWVKPLTGTDEAVAVVNLNDGPQVITLQWKKLGISPLKVRDVWQRVDLDPNQQQLSVELSGHATLLLRVAQ